MIELLCTKSNKKATIIHCYLGNAVLVINTLSFEMHTDVYDECGDAEPADRIFTVDRKSRILTMADFRTEGGEQAVTLEGGRMAKLLRYIVHTLER